MGKSYKNAANRKDRSMTPSMLIDRAVYLGNFVILFETTDGQMRSIDFKPMLKKEMGAFASLRDENVFRKFYIDTHVLTWNVVLPKISEKQINQFDIAPEFIFEHSRPVQPDKGIYQIQVAHS